MKVNRILGVGILGLSAVVIVFAAPHQSAGPAQHNTSNVVRVSDGRIGPNLVTNTGR